MIRRTSPPRVAEKIAGGVICAASRFIFGQAPMTISAVSCADRLPDVSANRMTPASRKAASSSGLRRMF